MYVIPSLLRQAWNDINAHSPPETQTRGALIFQLHGDQPIAVMHNSVPPCRHEI